MLKAFIFLATAYTPQGPIAYILEDGLSGEACVARMEAGALPKEELAYIDMRHVSHAERATPPTLASVKDAVTLSCEFDLTED